MYYCHCATSGNYRNELTRIHVSYVVGEEHASGLFSVYRVYSVTVDNVLMWICEV
jgi:hypothetical protein